MFNFLKKIAIRLKRWERGTSLVTALGAMTAIATFSVAVTYGVSTNIGQANRDRSAKRALAAAEAGAQEANYRMNMLQPTADQPCVVLDSGMLRLGSIGGGGSWCSPQTIDLGNGASASYQISPISVSQSGVVTREIVSSGNVDGVSRRVKATVSTKTGTPLFSGYAVESNQKPTIRDFAYVSGAVRSNDDIDVLHFSHICGQNAAAVPGPGKEVNRDWFAEVCGPMNAADAPFVLAPVDQGDAPTNNDNDRIASGEDSRTGSPSWNPSTRELTLNGFDTLTLGGHTYSFCRLKISGISALIIRSGANVRIYIDSMENCGYSYNPTSQRRQLDVRAFGRIRNVDDDPRDLQVYVMGGTPEQENEVYLGGIPFYNSDMLLYSPNSYVQVRGFHSVIGAIVGNRVTVRSFGRVTYDSRAEDIDEATVGIYRRQKYVQCNSTESGSTPDDGC